VPREWRLFIHDMQHSCSKIHRFCEGMSQEQFFENELVQDAVLRNLTIIGEAANRIPAEVQDQYPQIEWRKIVAFRNAAKREYFGLDRDIVWDVISRKVPELSTKLDHIE